jgi:hypothetical protein
VQITSVGQQTQAPQAVQSAAQKPAAAQPSAPAQDTVVLSDRAKDLAAKMAGKAQAEEMKESQAAKTREQQSQA